MESMKRESGDDGKNVRYSCARAGCTWTGPWYTVAREDLALMGVEAHRSQPHVL